MNQGQMVFSQIVQFASQDILRNIVRRYGGNYRKQEFTSWRHFLCMSFGQLTHRESMSDTMLMLKLNRKKLFHLGMKYHDKDLKKTFVFYTNNRKVKPETIAALYKSRWHVEIFFKWIKQKLRLQSFWGKNENAVRIQIWIAISAYVLVAIAKKRLGIKHSLYEILQYVSIAPFERAPLTETFSEEAFQETQEGTHIQLRMF